MVRLQLWHRSYNTVLSLEKNLRTTYKRGVPFYKREILHRVALELYGFLYFLSTATSLTILNDVIILLISCVYLRSNID